MGEYEIVLRFGHADSRAEIFLQVRGPFVPRVGEHLTLGPALPQVLPDPGPLEVQEVVHGPVQDRPPFQVSRPRVVVVVPDPGIETRRTWRGQRDSGWLGPLAVPEDA